MRRATSALGLTFYVLRVTRPVSLVSDIDVLAGHEFELVDELGRQGDNDWEADFESPVVGREQALIDGFELRADLEDLRGAAAARIGAGGHSNLVPRLWTALDRLANVADHVRGIGRSDRNDRIPAPDFLPGLVENHGHQAVDGRFEYGRLEGQFQFRFLSLNGGKDGGLEWLVRDRQRGQVSTQLPDVDFPRRNLLFHGVALGQRGLIGELGADSVCPEICFSHEIALGEHELGSPGRLPDYFDEAIPLQLLELLAAPADVHLN